MVAYQEAFISAVMTIVKAKLLYMEQSQAGHLRDIMGKNWRRECGSVTINGGRRMGHSTAVLRLIEEYSPLVIVPFKNQRELLQDKTDYKDIITARDITKYHNRYEYKDRIVVVDVSSFSNIDPADLDRLEPKLVVELG